MNPLSLIPFGLKLPEKELVDVSEVDRGRSCDCICPSCKTTLIARQGDKNEWHFAHDSKVALTKTIEACKYSFWVSVVLMAKQIIKDAKTVTLPSLTMYTVDGTKYEIAKEKSIKCVDLKVDETIGTTKVDAKFILGKYTVALFFTAPHRRYSVPHEIMSNDKIGILEISLNDAAQWLYGNNNRGNYRKTLEHNIIDSTKCKNWICHPRKISIEKQCTVKLYIEKKHIYNESAEMYDTPDMNYVTSENYGKCVICGKNLTSKGSCLECMRRY